jgi:hypothetical protein
MSGTTMEIINSALLLAILFFTQVFSQPMFAPVTKEENILNDLNLSSPQQEKMEKILSYKKDKLDNIRNKILYIMEILADSSQFISSESNNEILKVLNKEQAEKFKFEIEKYDYFPLTPPPDKMKYDFSRHKLRLNRAEPAIYPPDQEMNCNSVWYPPVPDISEQNDSEPDFREDQDDFFPSELYNPCQQDENDIDRLQDIDIFSLMDILE